MKNLHWLTIIANIDVKIVCDLTPLYLSSLLASSASVRFPRLMDIAYAPNIWKSLLHHIKYSESAYTFKKRLNTLFFFPFRLNLQL